MIVVKVHTMPVTTAVPGHIHIAPHAVHVHTMTTPAYLIITIIISIMVSINTNPANSPVIVDNPPKIGDQYLALLVLDRITNKTVHDKILFVLLCIGQLVGAIASVLGSHLRILALAKKHPNSHRIIAKLDVNDVTWMWLNTSPYDINFNTPKRGWDPSPYASSGVNQFFEIAN